MYLRHRVRRRYNRARIRVGRPPWPGRRPAPPDFVGVGVQKAGTTWWLDLIVAHPDVDPPIVKELHYLERYRSRPFDQAAIARYHRLFSRRPGRIAGEWTPGYIARPWSLDALVAAAPDAKVLVALRDPIDRLVSQRTMHARNGVVPSSAIVALAVRRGDYATQLEDLFTRLPRERVLVLQYEQMALDPQAQLARTYRFLGLDDRFVPNGIRELRNPAGRPNVDLDAAERDALLARYGPEMARLPDLVPDLDLSLWPSARKVLS
jgi:hypothetical protein